MWVIFNDITFGSEFGIQVIFTKRHSRQKERTIAIQKEDEQKQEKLSLDCSLENRPFPKRFN